MSIKDTARQDLRTMLLRDGNVKPSGLPSAFKHIDRVASRAAAIAARKQELNKTVTVTRRI